MKWFRRLMPLGLVALLGTCWLVSAPAFSAESDPKPLPTGGPRPALVVQSGHGAGFGYAAAFSPDGRRVLTSANAVYSAGEAILWEVATGRQVRSFPRPEAFQPGMEWFTSFAFSPDGWRIAAGSYGRNAVLWDARTGEVLHTFDHGHQGRWQALFSPDGRHVVFASQREAILWDADTGQRLRTFTYQEAEVTAAALEPKRGRQLLTASGIANEPSQIIVWDLTTGEKVRSWEPGPGAVYDIQFSLDGAKVLTVSTDSEIKPSGTKYQGTFAVWEAESGRRLSRIEIPGVLFGATFSADGRQVLVCRRPDFVKCGESKIITYDAASGAEVRAIPGEPLAASPDRAFLLVQQANKTETLFPDESAVEIRETASGAVARTLRSQCAEAAVVAPSSDGARLLTGYEINWLQYYCAVWDLAEGRFVRTFALPDVTREQASPNPDILADLAPGGRQLLLGRTADDQHHLTHIDAETGKVLAALDTDKKWESIGPLDNQGRVLALVDEELGLWLLASGKKSVGFAGTERKKWSLAGLALVHGGKEVFEASSSCGPTDARGVPTTYNVQWGLWDVSSGTLLHHFQEQVPTRVDSVAISDDGSRVAVGVEGRGLSRDETGKATDEPGAVVIYDAATGDALRTLSAESHFVTLLALSPDGTRLLLGWKRQNFATVYDCQSGAQLFKLDGHTSALRGGRFIADGRRIVTSSLDGTAIIWSAETGAELARLVTFDRGREWLIITPQGYFDGSVEGRKSVCWRIANEVFPVELYEKRFHRPDLVARAVRGEKLENVPVIPGDHTPPRVTLQTEHVDRESVTVKAVATAGSSQAKVTSVRVLVDGRDIAPVKTEGLARENADGPTTVFRGKILFPPGKSTAVVAAIATDEFGLQSDPAVAQIVRPGSAEAVQRDLYLLAVGVSQYKLPRYNLRFAGADAQALAQELQRQKGLAFSEVHARVLTDSDATIPNIRQALAWLQKDCGPSDMAVILFSGHGYRTQQGDLYYVPYEADPQTARATFLRWSEIDAGLRQVRAGSVLFLSDCCHAGAFGEGTASQDDLAYPLLTNARVMVFASSRGREPSLEKPELGHGAFTYAILQGLRGEADLFHDGRITISELQAYVANRVKVLTGDSQHPHIPRMTDFDPEMVVAHAR